MDTSNIAGEYLCPDVAWAKETLQKHKSKRHLFVCMHIAPVTWTKNMISCPDLIKLFAQQKNLRAVFHGHDHDQDNAKMSEGKPHFFDSHIGGNWGTDYRGYRVVEILKSGEIITYQVNPVNATKVNTNSIN